MNMKNNGIKRRKSTFLRVFNSNKWKKILINLSLFNQPWKQIIFSKWWMFLCYIGWKMKFNSFKITQNSKTLLPKKISMRANTRLNCNKNAYLQIKKCKSCSIDVNWRQLKSIDVEWSFFTTMAFFDIFWFSKFFKNWRKLIKSSIESIWLILA